MDVSRLAAPRGGRSRYSKALPAPPPALDMAIDAGKPFGYYNMSPINTQLSPSSYSNAPAKDLPPPPPPKQFGALPSPTAQAQSAAALLPPPTPSKTSSNLLGPLPPVSPLVFGVQSTRGAPLPTSPRPPPP